MFQEAQFVLVDDFPVIEVQTSGLFKFTVLMQGFECNIDYASIFSSVNHSTETAKSD